MEQTCLIDPFRFYCKGQMDAYTFDPVAVEASCDVPQIRQSFSNVILYIVKKSFIHISCLIYYIYLYFSQAQDLPDIVMDLLADIIEDFLLDFNLRLQKLLFKIEFQFLLFQKVTSLLFSIVSEKNYNK